MTKNILYGQSVSLGKTVGTARILYSREDYQKIEKGDILVSHRINPEMALSMVNINGIITERGSLVCHTASIAREFNIPAIINVANARDFIKNGDILELDAGKGKIKILFRKDSQHNSLYLTDKCNNNCIMCPLEKHKDFSLEGVNIEEIKKRIDKIPKITTHINISGGEPTIRKDIFEILKYIKNSLTETKISVLTNARMFSYKKFSFKLKEVYPKNIEIIAALHSFNEETHNFIAGSNSFKQTIKGIKNLLDLKFEVEIRIVINKLNYRQLPKISEFISQEFPSVGRVCFLYMELTGKAKENFEKVYVTHLKIMPYLEDSAEILKKCHIHFRLYHFPLCVLNKKMWNYVWDTITEYKKANPEICKNCTIKENCCGVFQSYVDLLGNKELKSI